MFFKKLALCMAIMMLLALLAGCHEDVETVSEGTVSDFESQAHIPVEISDDVLSNASADVSNDVSAGEISSVPLTGEIVVNEKKYDYKGNNIELLHVENQTNLHLNVTVRGTYFDADKKVIKEESQTFTAFPSGWSTYFIFYPYKPFDSFTYTVETERYIPEPLHADESGTPYVSFITLSFKRNLQWILCFFRNGEEGRALCFGGDATNTHPSKTLISQFNVLVLDENGEIYATDYDWSDPSSLDPAREGSMSGFPKPPMGVEDPVNKKNICLRKSEKGKEEPIPDTLQSTFTIIYAIREVVDEEEAMKQALGQ